MSPTSSYLKRRITGTWLDRPAHSAHRRLFGEPELSWVDRRAIEYDRQTARIIHRVMRRRSNSVDAGAHEGLYVDQLLRVSPRGSQYAFEPIPALAQRLRERYPRSIVHEMSLADYDGQAAFRYLPDVPAESSLLVRPDREAGHDVVPITVPVRRLDSVLPPDLLIDFLKVDVEGAERAVFRGAAQTLTRSRPVVVFECHTENLVEASDLLAESGLRVHLIPDFLAGRIRSRNDVEALAIEAGHWYFAAAPPTSR